MEKSKKPVKKNQELLKMLNSSKPTDNINAIKKLRDVGNVNYLPDLFGIYNNSLPEQVKKELCNFICDLKDLNAAPHVVNFIEGIDNEEDRAMFTSCCWQSRVDFSEHTGFFVSSIISGSYQTMIEAFTVIEECIDQLGQDELNQYTQSLKNAIIQMNEEKRTFVKLVIDTLQAGKGG